MLKNTSKNLKIVYCVFVILVFVGLAIFIIFRINKTQKKMAEIRNSAIELSDEETMIFKTYYGIDIPDYLYITDRSFDFNLDESEGYFAIKAVISNKDVRVLINKISNDKSLEVYKHSFARRPVVDYFEENLSWWDIDSGKCIASYNVHFDNNIGGSGAMTITKVDGINYVYLWYTYPAQITK